MSDFDFDKQMLDLHINIPTIPEMRAAYNQANLGFELVCARVAGANNPAAALISLIRAGAHLRAEGDLDAAKEKQRNSFVCKFCGSLPQTNAENHYANFPEHKDGKPVVLSYAPAPNRTRTATVVRSAADVKDEFEPRRPQPGDLAGLDET